MHTGASLCQAAPKNVVDEARHLLQSHFGRDPDPLVLAPGRVNLIGERVDYNDGLVLPMAIERHLVPAASPKETARASVVKLRAGRGRAYPGNRHLRARMDVSIASDLPLEVVFEKI